MSTDSVQDVEGLEDLAMTVHEQNGPVARQEQRAMTPAQAKVDAVANLTMKAYERASTLALTAEEIAALTAEFPDEAFKPGAAGKEHLIYIEHAFLRDRLNYVFGPGQWAVIPRSRWAEEFKTNAGKDGSRIYVEAMLLIRGCFVAEAVGAMEYYPGNAAQNYGDAVEGAKTAALRRCAKELGVGLQAWKKDFCDGWWERRRGNRTPPPTRGHRQQPADKQDSRHEHDPEDDLPFEAAKNGPGASGTSPHTTPPVKTPPAKPQERPAAPTQATEEQKAKMIGIFEAEKDGIWKTETYYTAIGALGDKQPIQTVPLTFVPRLPSQMRTLGEQIAAYHATGKAERCLWMPAATPKAAAVPATATPTRKPAEVPREGTVADDDVWRSFEMPWGKQSGTPLGDLDKKYLYGLWANYEVETEYNGKPKKPETIAKDQHFRDMLDLAGEHYEFTKND